jgi:hypothetical protein
MNKLAQILTPKRMVIILIFFAGVLGIVTVVGKLTAAPTSSGIEAPTVAQVQNRIHVTPPMPKTSPGPDCYPDAEAWEHCTGRPTRRVVFDINPARGAATCRTHLAVPGSVRGSSCQVKTPNVDPHGGPGNYTEYDNDPERGRARCTEDLRHDLNLTATCNVLPTARGTAEAAG